MLWLVHRPKSPKQEERELLTKEARTLFDLRRNQLEITANYLEEGKGLHGAGITLGWHKIELKALPLQVT
jgi:hypothetical protein